MLAEATQSALILQVDSLCDRRSASSSRVLANVAYFDFVPCADGLLECQTQYALSIPNGDFIQASVQRTFVSPAWPLPLIRDTFDRNMVSHARPMLNTVSPLATDTVHPFKIARWANW